MANELSPANARNALSVTTRGSGSYLIPQTFGQVVDFAKDMSRAQTAVPKHLRDNPGACMAVAMQAFEWGMSPFAVANKSYSVNDRIAYEAQLIAAVVNTRSGIKGRLKYKFEGSGGDLRCTVMGEIDGDVLEYRSPLFKDIHPKNSPLWKSDPEQQLGYYSARAWARRHVPEVILGVYDRDEMEGSGPVIDNEPPAVDDGIVVAETFDAETGEITGGGEQQEDAPAYGAFHTLGDYLEALETAMAGAKDEADVEEAWSEFDPMATLEGDDDAQAMASKMKERRLSALTKPKAVKARAEEPASDDEPPSAGGLFSDD